MSRKIQLLMSGLAIAPLVFAFLVSSAIANLFAAPTPPTGTYWNVEGYFGDSELKLLDGSHYSIGGIGAVTAEGRYTVKGDQIVFREYGPADAPCLHKSGTYAWKMHGKFLTLAALDDPCSSRKLDWATGQWQFMTSSTVTKECGCSVLPDCICAIELPDK